MTTAAVMFLFLIVLILILLKHALIRMSLCLYNTRNLVLTIQHFDLRQIHARQHVHPPL
jgi:hypothetical protein